MAEPGLGDLLAVNRSDPPAVAVPEKLKKAVTVLFYMIGDQAFLELHV